MDKKQPVASFLKMIFDGMNKSICIVMCLLMTIMVLAQTQQGYVKTKGRLGSNGQVIAGSSLSGATITVRGGNTVVSSNNGRFSLTISTSSYYLQNVQKQGYVLTDPDVLSKQYVYSKNPLTLVMETPSQQVEDRLAAEKKIRRTLKQQLQEREDEIEMLKEQHRLSEENYHKQLQELYAQQESNEKLISEMAERYSKMDFDEVDEFNRKISNLILDGKLTEADSLLNTKGDINSRASTLRQHQEANAQAEQDLKIKQKKLEKSKALTQKELDDLALDCYSKFEICKIQHLNDSAAYYIELRASLDTTNIVWQSVAGDFLLEYFMDDAKAMQYYQNELNQAQKKYGWLHREVAVGLNNIGFVYKERGLFSDAMNYFEKAKVIHQELGDTICLADIYLNIGTLCKLMQDYQKALENENKAKELYTSVYGEKHLNVARCYNNLGETYVLLGDYETGLKCHKKSLDIKLTVSDDKSVDVAYSYNNMSDTYVLLENPQEGIAYAQKALEIFYNIYGEKHVLVAICNSNIGKAYTKLANYEKAMEYYEKALKIYNSIYGMIHSKVALCYNNMGVTCNYMEQFDKALEYHHKALEIKKSCLGESHVDVAASYFNIGSVYLAQKQYKTALDYFNQALSLFQTKLPDSHPTIKYVKSKIELATSKLQEKELNF